MKTEIYVIDRIEGEYAVCIPENGAKNLEIPTAMIPDAAEGMTLEVTFRDDSFCVKAIKGSDRKKKNHQRLKKLFNK